MDTSKFTREELYNLIWSQPFMKLSKKYSISDVGLRKMCIRMNIPVPPSGYWSKVKYGKEVHVPILPANYSGEAIVTLLLRKDGESSHVMELSKLELLQREIENDPKLIIQVPQRLITNNKLILSAKESLLQGKSNYWNRGGKIYASRGELDIQVESKNIDRALRFMDTFIKLIIARGHEIKVDTHGTFVIISGEQIQISFREKTKKIIIKEKYGDRTDYQVNGILFLKIVRSYGAGPEWKDGRELIEQQLAKIIAKLEIEGKRLKDERLERERYWAEQREKERIKREEKEREEKEKARFTQLIEDANRWHQSILISNYINNLEENAKISNVLSEESISWFEWARKKLEEYQHFSSFR